MKLTEEEVIKRLFPNLPDNVKETVEIMYSQDGSAGGGCHFRFQFRAYVTAEQYTGLVKEFGEHKEGDRAS